MKILISNFQFNGKINNIIYAYLNIFRKKYWRKYHMFAVSVDAVKSNFY